MSKFKALGLNWYQSFFQDQIDINFKLLWLNWYKKITENQIHVNFKILGLKILFTYKVFISPNYNSII